MYNGGDFYSQDSELVDPNLIFRLGYRIHVANFRLPAKLNLKKNKNKKYIKKIGNSKIYGIIKQE